MNFLRKYVAGKKDDNFLKTRGEEEKRVSLPGSDFLKTPNEARKTNFLGV